jgi:hypothetical protein
MKLHEFVDRFHDELADLAGCPSEIIVGVWAEKLTRFIEAIKTAYPDVAKVDAPSSFLIRKESPDFEHAVVGELRKDPGEWYVVQDLPSRVPNEAAYACDSHERVELRRTYRAYYARFRTDEEIDGALESLLKGDQAA